MTDLDDDMMNFQVTDIVNKAGAQKKTKESDFVHDAIGCLEIAFMIVLLMILAVYIYKRRTNIIYI